MWLTLSLLSALFLGLNEVAKKSALNSNAVIPVLAVSIWISALLFLPLQISSMAAPAWIRESAFYIPPVSAEAHWGIVLKAVIVLGSWIFGFFATKHLPLTISASIKATRPAFVVLGAVLIFGERLDATRWTGVAVVLGALTALSRLDKRDGRDDRESPRRKTLWLWFLIASTLLGAASALWDKFLIARYDRLAVQAYTCYYQSLWNDRHRHDHVVPLAQALDPFPLAMVDLSDRRAADSGRFSLLLRAEPIRRPCCQSFRRSGARASSSRSSRAR